MLLLMKLKVSADHFTTYLLRNIEGVQMQMRRRVLRVQSFVSTQSLDRDYSIFKLLIVRIANMLSI